MAWTLAGFKTRLEPRDEFPPDPGDARNYHESMYFNAFDPGSKAGDRDRVAVRLRAASRI